MFSKSAKYFSLLKIVGPFHAWRKKTVSKWIWTQKRLVTESLPTRLPSYDVSLLLFIFRQRVYVATSRQLKRIESVSRSPIYSHYLETINGASTIRAYSQKQRFIQDNFYRTDENQVAYYSTISSNRWGKVLFAEEFLELKIFWELCQDIIIVRFVMMFKSKWNSKYDNRKITCKETKKGW